MIPFVSTNSPALQVSFREAVLKGLAPDGGLYMPARIPLLPAQFFAHLPDLTFPEIALHVASAMLEGAVPEQELKAIVEGAFSFPVLLKPLEPRLQALELFHG